MYEINKNLFVYAKNKKLCIGITIVIGGQYFAWNLGLTVGFGSFVLATFFIGKIKFKIKLIENDGW